jgi:hypothetical protein
MVNETPGVDVVRARLRELGYLDAGVDRFVLGPVRGGRGPFAAAWRASLRIGFLAALLFGPSTAIALGVRLPGFITGARDAVVLAVYLGGLFGVGVAALSLLAVLALAHLAGRSRGLTAGPDRGPLLARGAGAIVALACLAYMVLWWRTVNPAGTVWSSAAWTWPVLAFSTALSMLLGRSVTFATLAVEAQRAGAAGRPLPAASRSWRLTAATAAAGFLAAAAMLFLTTRGETPPPAGPPPLARVPSGVHLTVVAVDGLDLSFLRQMAAAGRVPRLARLLEGAWLILPASDAPDPARTWTSLATGQPADVHGVSGIEGRSLSGMVGAMPTSEGGLAGAIETATDLVRLTRPVLTTGLQRRSKTFWEIASDCGLRTAVVNWWATWPAPPGPGVVLSDRAMLRLERGGALDAEIAPPSVYQSLRPAWPSIKDEARRLVLAAFEGLPEEDAAVLSRAAEQDALSVSLAGRVFPGATDLRAIYLSGLDIAQHNLAGSGGASGLPPSVLAARVTELERYYVFLDRLIEPLVADPPPGTVFALLGDPGRSASRGPGLLALSGSIIRADKKSDGRGRDVAPTILYLLGIPLSRELNGRPRIDLVDQGFSARVAVRTVATYGQREISPRPPSATPLDRDMLDRLRSLGYVR